MIAGYLASGTFCRLEWLVSLADASLGLLHLCMCLSGLKSCLGWWWRSCGLSVAAVLV
jgi:hypothetical protein